MKSVLYVLFAFSLVISGLILQINIVDVDIVNTTSWNFTGAPIAVALTEWLGGLLMLVGGLAIFIMAVEGRA